MRNRREADRLGVVLDTSVVVAAYQSRRGASAEILRLWRETQSFQLILSDPILEEIARVLLERSVPEPVIRELLRVFHLQALVTDNLYIVRHVQSDPADDMLLAAALEGQADFVVSLDHHLLSLKHHHGIQLVRPHHLLKRLRG